MMGYQFHERVTRRMAEIENSGGNCTDFYGIVERLRLGRDMPQRFNDHALTGRLTGLRSVIVGHDGNGETVIAVYQVVRRTISVAIVDEHDKAYAILKSERTSRRRRR